MTTTTNNTEFTEALEAILNAHRCESDAHTRAAWHLAEAVADGLMGIECAKQLMKKIGDAISASNDDNYNRGYGDGYTDAEEVFND